MRSQKSNFDTKPTQLLQLAPKTKIFMLRWRSSSNQTCSWQSARHRKETGRCGTAKMGMKTGLVLWGISPVLYLRKNLKPQIRHPDRRISPGLFVFCFQWQGFIKLQKFRPMQDFSCKKHKGHPHRKCVEMHHIFRIRPGGFI